MKYCIYDQNGMILRHGHAAPQMENHLLTSSGGLVLFFEEDQPIDDVAQYVDLQTQTLTNYPARPGPEYRWSWDTHSWEASSIAADQIARQKRQQLLQDSDWTDTASAPARLGQETYSAWQQYRQALRDIPAQSGYPLVINWPATPNS